MHVRRLCLSKFRNYELAEMEASPGLNVLVGENGQGKSNVLEAVYMLATTKSFRATKDMEVIRRGDTQSVAFAEVDSGAGYTADVEVTIQQGDRKSARINGATTSRALDVLGTLNAVFFGALDLRLVHGEPAARRRYVDLAIAQTSPAYCRDLGSYKRSVDHRNRILREMRERPGVEMGLDVWSEQLVRYGSPVVERRMDFAAELAELACQAHGELSGGRECLTVRYASSVSAAADESIAGAFTRELGRVRETEVKRGASLIGPHRDDLRLAVDGMEARSFASQGQQRTVVLSLKLAEMQFMEAHCGRPPVMLLDDVMSDLDDDRRARLLQRVRGRCQTFVTCTNLRAFPQDILAEARVFMVRDGTVEAVAG
jgi:DNA replication and repair protein RecF